jgi:hypothetical protein
MLGYEAPAAALGHSKQAHAAKGWVCKESSAHADNPCKTPVDSPTQLTAYFSPIHQHLGSVHHTQHAHTLEASAGAVRRHSCPALQRQRPATHTHTNTRHTLRCSSYAPRLLLLHSHTPPSTPPPLHVYALEACTYCCPASSVPLRA